MEKKHALREPLLVETNENNKLVGSYRGKLSAAISALESVQGRLSAICYIFEGGESPVNSDQASQGIWDLLWSEWCELDRIHDYLHEVAMTDGEAPSD